MLVVTVQVAHGAIEQGGDERRDVLRKAVVTDVKKVKGRVTTRSGQVVHKPSTQSLSTGT